MELDKKETKLILIAIQFFLDSFETEVLAEGKDHPSYKEFIALQKLQTKLQKG